MQRTLVLLCLLTVSGCAAGPPSTSSPPSQTPEETPKASDEPTPRMSLEPSTTQPSRGVSGEQQELTGVLGADSIEGGCGYLETPGGTRYEVIYPDGWQLQLSPLQLTSPVGDVVARGGDELTVRGAEAADMASICQIGPIFRATEVES